VGFFIMMQPRTLAIFLLTFGVSSAALAAKPNEIGRIPIVMYHSVGEKGKYDSRGLNISPATFRKHLEMMVKANWYPMNVRDIYIPARLAAVPKGMTPVGLTFDDARGSQFRYGKDGSIDPNCALGILEAFHARHSERWPRAGTFYMLPRSSYNPTPFWQAGKEAQKCQWLLKAGYELGNHSFAHKNMAPMSTAQVREAVWGCIRDIRKLAPGATMDTFCVPYGSYPRDKAGWDVILKDPQGQYTNKIALKAWGDESYAPSDKRFDPRQVDRIGVDPGYFERVYARLVKSGKLYISDGDPATLSVPRSWEAFVAKNRIGGLKLALYGNPAPAKSPRTKKPIKAASR
jgi:peptidoglycan/xylan/chitin deacetylase (PgdA/CDA1 family)